MEGEERIGLGGAAAVLDVPVETVRRLVDEGRLGAERDKEGAYTFSLSEVMDLSRELGAEAAEEEIFEGEIIGDEPGGSSRLPAAPFWGYERPPPQGQDYKNRPQGRSSQMEEIRQECGHARQ